MLPITTKSPMSQRVEVPLYGSLDVGEGAKSPGDFLRKVRVEMIEKIMGVPAVYEPIA